MESGFRVKGSLYIGYEVDKHCITPKPILTMVKGHYGLGTMALGFRF